MGREREYFVTFTRFRDRIDGAIGALRRLTISGHLPFREVAAYYRADNDVAVVKLIVDPGGWNDEQQAVLRAWAKWERLPLLDERTLCPSEWVTFYEHYLPSFEHEVGGFARPETALHTLAWQLAREGRDDDTLVTRRAPTYS